ncbi:MAG: serine/threonine-protein kinase, partial [Acidobacteriota bacterium]
MTGVTIGPYRVIRELGQGGMGTVVLADDTRLGRQVALKTVSGAQAGTAGGRAQLLDEARAAAAISHPAIATVHDVVEHEGDIAIVFEFVEGETLAARLAKGPLPEDQAIQIAIQLADALNVAHGHRVLHRDLKPANVMLAPGGVVKILDFGIARFRPVDQAGTGAEGDRGFMGTPGYVAPEQWVGKPADERSDLYALGVVIFEMVTGKRPFPEREPFTLARAAIERIARRVSSLVPTVSPGLDKLVARLLAADPALRPPRARVV